jgi:hypothetical protein
MRLPVALRSTASTMPAISKKQLTNSLKRIGVPMGALASVYTLIVNIASTGAGYICVTCGVEFPPDVQPPERCPICEDFRQYVGLEGQQWTTAEELARTHRNRIEEIDSGVFSIHTNPKFGIGQRCLLVQSAEGNVLWDCISLLDEETIRRVRDLGGIAAIAISHPHYYATMVDWSAAFGNAPILLHEEDRDWVLRPDRRIEFWAGETHQLNSGMTLIHCGGHFDGGQVMHWSHGALFTGDILQVVSDRRWVSFMRSYPNYIPLPAWAVERIVEVVEPFAFNRIYGAWPRFEIRGDGKGVVKRSAERYIRALSEVLKH